MFKWGLRYYTTVNRLGYFTLTMDNNDSRAAAFQRDGLVEIRRFPDGASDWRTEDVYVIRSPGPRIRTPSGYQFTVSGPSLMWMLRTATIIPLATDTDGYSRKSGKADHVAKDYAREQVGVSAGIDWQFPELTIEANLPVADAGNDVSRAVRYNTDGKLDDLIFSIAEEGDIDFWMEWTPPNPGVAPAQIRFRGGQYGTDRTETTNLSLGQPYFIFSPARGNVIEDRLDDDWTNANTVTFVLGAGEGQNQEVQRVPTSGIAVGSGRWDTVAAVVDDPTAEAGDTTALFNTGVQNNFDNRPRRDVAFRARQVDGSRYGVHYFAGDLVTYDDPDNSFTADYRIRGVNVYLSGNGEVIDIETERI